MMDPEQRKRLEREGWRVGSAEVFLELTPQEAALVELRLKRADAVKVLGRPSPGTELLGGPGTNGRSIE